MKITFKFAIEIRRRPACKRRHADDPPEQLASVTDATIDLARGYWDHDCRSPVTAARFGFSQPAPARGAQQ